MQNRIIGIDMARSLAILLVTWKHCMYCFGATGELSGWAHYGLETLMQLATPVFLILFGTMLELVYRPRFERGLRRDTTQRLFKRSLQCYGYYCLAIIVFFMVLGTYSWLSLPVVFAGFISVPNSHLLAFYAAALALSPGLIFLRVRYGLKPIIAASVLVHLCHFLINQLPAAPELFGRDYLQHMSGFLYGRGVDFIGPSLLHGMTLVCFGMLFGFGLRKSSRLGDTASFSPNVSYWIMGITAVWIVILWDWQSPLNVLQSLADASLRIDSHPLYFAVGIFGATLMTLILIYLYDFQKMKVGRSLEVYGRRSLFAFGIGNILTYITPASWISLFGVWGSVLLLFSIVCALTIAYDQLDQFLQKTKPILKPEPLA